MDWSTLLKIGVMVDVTTKDGVTTTGFLDEVGFNQFEKKILLANQRPVPGITFAGRKIDVESIEAIRLSAAAKASF